MNVFRLAGFDPHFVQPDWHVRDARVWAKHMFESAKLLVDTYGSVTLSGFSFGAATAVLAAEKLIEYRSGSVHGLVLLSLSQVFGEEHAYRIFDTGYEEPIRPERPSHAYIPLELPKLTCPLQLYVGLDDAPSVQDMLDRSTEAWPQAEVIRPQSEHDALNPFLLQAIDQNIGRLLINDALGGVPN